LPQKTRTRKRSRIRNELERLLSNQPFLYEVKRRVKDLSRVETLYLRPIILFEKHEKIFAVWDSLESGETLKITDPDDPKLLHYQFEAAYKDKYEWGYNKKDQKTGWYKLRNNL